MNKSWLFKKKRKKKTAFQERKHLPQADGWALLRLRSRGSVSCQKRPSKQRLLLPTQPHSSLCISRHRAQICRLETIIRLMFVRHLVPGSLEHLAGSILLTLLGLLGGRDLWAGKGACSMHSTQQHRWHVWATSHTFLFNLGCFWRSSFLPHNPGEPEREPPL